MFEAFENGGLLRGSRPMQPARLHTTGGAELQGRRILEALRAIAQARDDESFFFRLHGRRVFAARAIPFGQQVFVGDHLGMRGFSSSAIVFAMTNLQLLNKTFDILDRRGFHVYAVQMKELVVHNKVSEDQAGSIVRELRGMLNQGEQGEPERPQRPPETRPPQTTAASVGEKAAEEPPKEPEPEAEKQPAEAAQAEQPAEKSEQPVA
jgi:hypothetical protein